MSAFIAAAFGTQDIGLQSNFRGPSGQQGPYGSSGKPSVCYGLLEWSGTAFMQHCNHTPVNLALRTSFEHLTKYSSSTSLQLALCADNAKASTLSLCLLSQSLSLPYSLLPHLIATGQHMLGTIVVRFCCLEGPTLCLA